MKVILAALLLVPTIAFGQQKRAEKHINKIAIGLKQGISPDNSYYPLSQFKFGYIRSSLNVVADLKHIQAGLTVEGGTLNNDHWYLAPAALLNCKIHTGNSYFYTGMLLGYIYMRDMLGLSNYYGNMPGHKRYLDGMLMGVHFGYNKTINKHWAFTSEAGMRTAVITEPVYDFDGYPASTKTTAVIMLPISLGMQYSF